MPAPDGALPAAGLCAIALLATRRRNPREGAPVAWLALLAATAAGAGIGFGALRLHAINAGALDVAPGSRVTVDGFVAAVPRRADGEVDVRVDTPDGRLLVEAPEPVPDLDVGAGVEATGTIRAPGDFERAYLARLGVRRILGTDSIELTGTRRGGLAGVLDRVRDRAQEALSAGTPPASAALLRGFVLGQDDRIDAATRDDFKRSGLAHLLAVSGQNVVLLAILAAAALALAGVPIRARLIAIGGLIFVYVLLTGAGPSIQRAGVMGGAGVAAALAGRPRSRWYVLLLAAAVTLALNPRAAGDVGWQLSFAAVVGILLFCGPLARLLAGPEPRRTRRALAEAAALTISATLATAPLIALQFGVASVVALPANLAAVVAEAPVMWLGMIAAAVGQVPAFPVEPISWLAGLLAAYVAQVAAWFGAPGWAQVDLGLGGVGGLAAAYALLGSGLALALRWSGRRRGLGAGSASGARWRLMAAVVLAVGVLGAARIFAAPPGGPAGGRPPGLRVSVLDVGQGDAILLDPADGDPILVDAGPAAADVASQLRSRGVDALAALVVTHSDSDHSGGAPAVLEQVGARHLLFGRAGAPTLGAAHVTGTDSTRVKAGYALRSGHLRLRVLWPPSAPILNAGAPSNAHSLVLLARWRRFRILLTGDAEAELAPVHPGDVDVLKVAHHGSEDAGLPRLLEETTPELAVISVGADNPYGHPAPETLAALTDAGVPVARTDVDGEVDIAVGGGAWAVGAAVPQR